MYSVELASAPPQPDRPGAMAAIPYVVQIAKTQAKGGKAQPLVVAEKIESLCKVQSKAERLLCTVHSCGSELPVRGLDGILCAVEVLACADGV